MANDNSNLQILPEVQSDVSKFFDTKINILDVQEARLERMLKTVRAYSASYKLSKERALSALHTGISEANGSKLDLSSLPAVSPLDEEVSATDSYGVDTEHSDSETIEVNNTESVKEPVLSLSSDLVYDKHWNHSLKVQFVILEPQKYGRKTFDGSNSVVDAILTHEPEWANRESRAAILGKIAPTISKLVKRKKIIKLRRKDTKADFHYVSMRWYDQKGIIKPEYKAAIAHLERVAPEKKLAPVEAGANNEVAERNGGHPSTNAVGDLNGSISLGGKP